MARTETLVQLTEELVAQLDAESARRGCSRSALIREAVETHLAQQSESARVQAWIDGYRRIPQGSDDWGDIASPAAGRALSARLDSEEAGDPW
jgi:predicted DNA-binding protein